ncbi:creatininase family protein [Haloferula chungangensis]|uniref:Creatininase family protein n=1 Tax=Haloferula chungangensis TaxID=1048331 RepID=A0ABW2L619_9BACT
MRDSSNKSAVILENQNWSEISKLQKEHGGMLLLPMGATEQHGPHLPVAMDTLLVEKLCQKVSARTGVPVMSALRYTVSQGHTPKWPGTFSLRHETFIAVLRELAGWAEATGWKRLLLVNSHFGNDAPARVAVDQLRLELMGRLQVGLVHVFQLNDEIWRSYTDDAGDLHANRAETSLMLHLCPELVDRAAMQTSDDPDRTVETVFSYPVAQTSLNGVTGRPSDATQEEGKALFSAMVEAMIRKVASGVREEPPLPTSEWGNLASIRYD